MRIPGTLVVVVATAASGMALMWNPGGRGGDAALAGASGYARVSMSDCSDWRAAGIAQRLRLVSEMGDHFGHPSPIWGGARMPDGEARRVVEQACRAPQASDIRLYKIYSRALTFRAYRTARRGPGS